MKQYIGDAVYVDFDGYSLVLTTEDGICATNRIVLEPEVYGALIGYVAGLRSASGKPRAAPPEAVSAVLGEAGRMGNEPDGEEDAEQG